MLKKQKTKIESAGEEEFSKMLDLTGRRSFSSETEEENPAAADDKEIFRAKTEIGEELFPLGSGELNAVKWRKLGKFFLYALIFLSPLFFLPLTIAPVETNKLALASLLAILSFICYLAGAIISKKIVYPGTLAALAVLGVVFSMALSSFFSEARHISFYGNLIQPDSLIAFAVYGLIFFLAAALFEKKDFNKIGMVFLSGLIPAAIIGLLQLTGNFILPFSFAKQANFNTIGSVFDFGFFMAFGLVLTAAALSELKPSLFPRIFLSISGLMLIAGLVILNWQYLWLEIALIMAILLANNYALSPDPIKSGASRDKKYGNIGASLTVLIVSLAFFIISPSLPPMADIPLEVKPDFSSTIAAAGDSLKGGRFIIGSGPATFGYDFLIARPAEINKTDFWQIRFNQGFSFLSTALATSGILGVLALMFLIFSFVCLFFKNLSNGKSAVVSAGVMFLLLGWFFHPPFLAQFIFIFFGLGLLSSFSSSRGKIYLLGASKARAAGGLIAAVVLIAGSLALSYFVGQKYIAAAYYQKGITSSDLQYSLINLNKAIMLDSDSDRYLRALSQYLLLDIANEKSKEDNSAAGAEESSDRIQNDLALAVQTAQRAAVINPADSLNWVNLADIYEKISPLAGGADTFAEKNYKEAIRLDPKNPELPFALARVYLASADKISAVNSSGDAALKDKTLWREKISDALSALEKSIALKADYAPAHFQLAMIYLREGNTGEAIRKLEYLKSLAPFDPGLAFQLGAIYYDNNQPDKAQIELERAVRIDPNYSNARYILGLVYDKQDKKLKAIDQFEKIAFLNPDNPEIKKILKNLKNEKNALDGLASFPNAAPLAPDLDPEPENTMQDSAGADSLNSARTLPISENY